MFTNDTWCCLSLNNNIIISYENGQYYWALYVNHFSYRIFSPWVVAITTYHPHFPDWDTVAHGDVWFSHSHKAYEGVPIQAYVLSRLHSQRLPAFYYEFFQQLGEENKMSIISNLQVEKQKLGELNLDKLVESSMCMQLSTFSSSLLLSCAPGVLSSSPWPSRASPVLLIRCPAHLREGLFLILFREQKKNRISERQKWTPTFSLPPTSTCIPVLEVTGLKADRVSHRELTCQKPEHRCSA